MLKDIISLKKYLLSLILRPRKASVLMYHSVANDNRFFSVSPVNFEKQLKFLRERQFNTIGINGLLKNLKNKNSFLPKTVALSFDDGYQNNYSVVFPLLKKYNLPATIFLIADLVGKEGYLNWEEIREMRQSGLVCFGCHTLSHSKLTQIFPEQLKIEVAESKKIIEEKSGGVCDIFAYPFGDFNENVTQAVQNAGFRGAFSVKEGVISSKNGILVLPRLAIDSSTSWWQFLGKISGLQFIKHKI